MNCFSVNAWLNQQVRAYQMQLQDATVDFFIAEHKLNLDPKSVLAVKSYYLACMRLADISYNNGDDSSYLQALKKNYSRMFAELKYFMNDDDRCQIYQYARQCLRMICDFYALRDEENKARHYRTHFVKQMSKYPLFLR